MAVDRQNLLGEDDGLACPEVGAWAEDKYRLVALYDELFSMGMKNRWDERVYVDLYAGAGFGRVRGTKKILKGTPLLALGVSTPFDKYIFCEENGGLLSALKDRTARLAPQATVAYVAGSCDVKVEEISSQIPMGASTNTVLSLCVVDPFDFGLKFSTLRRLSQFYIDFLVLLAIGMDANRNYEHYVDGDSPKIDEALGNTDWRERWRTAGARRSDFRQFLASEFSTSMETLGYIRLPLDRMRSVRSDDKNLPLYHIALFSRNQRGYEFWDQVLKYSTDQQGLWD